ncbi:LemA family protein [Candidatus Similichlamydia laticola]|uniref:LemA protein n=1 Tax=Candidatus Similichlamydia laticola TaxID=2170265 RepID=A0A369KJU9_9BACT|nr:LemA family protein [Candidatus Similichlamydia laticola]RDB31256.1 hypothetical protein HAT2_00641 [Candidatus Similichlamydia laticola]
MEIYPIVLAGTIFASVGWFIFSYNRLAEYKARAHNHWHQINVQLQRRYDLIPNLVETARTTMNFEKSTLESVVQARNMAARTLQGIKGNLTAEKMEALFQADQLLTSNMHKFLAVVEQYPNLRSVENMRCLHEELVSTENRIAFARQAYNDAVTRYNESQMRIPTKWIASCTEHAPMEFYPISSEEVKNSFR